MAGIEHDNNGPIAPGFTRFRPALRRRNLPLKIAFVVIFEQRQQRILHVGGVSGIEVHDQTLFKPGDRSQRKQLRFHVLFQLKHHAHGLRIELPHASRLNIGIVTANLTPHTFQYGVEINPFQIHHHTFRIAERKLPIFQDMVGLHGDARVGR